MTQPLQGKTVALAEGRQLEELAQLLDSEGASILRYPMLQIEDAPDEESIASWLRDFVATPFDYFVLMTGEALRRLVGFADRANIASEFREALTKTTILTRGPKPITALREINLDTNLTAKKPTSEGVIATLQSESLLDKRVAITLYGNDGIPPLEEFLAEQGATVSLVKPYIYTDAVEDARVIELVERLSKGEVDVLVITSTPQADRLFEVAKARGIESTLREGLTQTRVAAVGPIAAESLRRHSAPVHICPEQGFVMKNLVKQIARAFE